MTSFIAAFFAADSVTAATNKSLPNRLEVTKEGTPDGKAEFEVTVSGDIEPTDDFEDEGSDSIDGNTATGIIGPESGTDTIRYSGEITTFSLDGPAVVYRNGEEVDPDDLGVNADDLPHRLEVTKEGAPDGKAEFEVTVSGDLAPLDDFEDHGSDSIDGNTATGIIGPESGTDTVKYSGEITDFSLDGPAIVYWNGVEVDPEDLGSVGRILRVTPVEGEVTVSPDTTLMFEVASPDFSGDYLESEWFVDDEEVISPGQPEWREEYRFTRNMDYGVEEFTSSGTYEVRVTVYNEDKEDELGTISWTVHVEDDSGTAPSTQRVSPKDDQVEVSEDGTVTVTLSASDSDGDLHRVIWWEGVCDEVLKMDEIGGSEVELKETFDVGRPVEGCPIFAWVVDEHGHRTMSDSWRPVEDEGNGSPQHELEVTKDGAPDGKAEFEVTVSGEIEPTDDFEGEGSDSIDGNTATGIIGPESGTDTVRYSGDITDFSLDGPAVVYRDGEEVDPEELGDGGGGLPNSLEVTKEGAEDGKAEFEVTVSGDLQPTDSFEDGGSDSIDGDTATGIIGPESGTDAVRYSGEITAFSLDGPAVVYRNGEEVDPDDLG